jgi:hypothetical protein
MAGKTPSSSKTESKASAEPKAAAKRGEQYRVPSGAGWANGWKIAAAFGGIGILGSILAASSDPRRFAFAWLFAFMAGLAIALGALFFVIIQQLTKAGWSVTIRRPMEFFAAGLPVFAILFVPVWLGMDHLYPWVHHARQHEMEEELGIEEEGESAPAEGAAEDGEEHGSLPLLELPTALAQDHGDAHGEGGEHAEGHHSREHEAHEALIEAKLGYLNPGFFTIRAFIYFAIWILLAFFFVRTSLAQDRTKDLGSSRRMNTFAPLGVMTLALSLTFAAFDWMMSLEPAWYSTIFGVQYFAVSAVSSLAVLVVTLYSLRAAGLTGNAVHVEHFHDVGKLLFGFLVFWAYITFSQFMLIWYAGIPEEATYYHLRAHEGWWTFSVFLLVAHFILPFFFLISRNVKRNIPWLAFGAGWLLVMHVLECYWLVMPYAAESGALEIQWMDFAAVFAVLGTYLGVVLFMATRFPLIPIGDPRLPRGLHHEVV